MDTSALALIRKSINEVRAKLIRPVPGTVTTEMAAYDKTGVALDTDPSGRQVIGVSLVGPIAQGTRVFCLAYAPHGLVILGILGLTGEES